MSELYNKNDQERPATRRLPSTKSILGLTFGIFMVILYVGMGVLCLINFFGWDDQSWGWLRWVAGPVLIIYGFFRGWRQYVMYTRDDE